MSSYVEIASRDEQLVRIDLDSEEGLAPGFRGSLVTAASDDYENARALWNGMIATRPALIAQCHGVVDVVAAVNFARRHDLLMTIRAGGHNVAGLASCEGGLVIDLTKMRGSRVDPVARTARVEGGARLGDLDNATQVFGLAVPAGVVSTTGVAGLALGGGTGWQTRYRGLTVDNLRSADIVTASGEVVVANEEENPDLLWGLRGGGGSFGVATSLEFDAYPLGPMVTVADPHYPLERAGEVVRAYREFMADAPDVVGGALVFWTIPEHPLFPSEHHGKRTVQPILVYVGEDGDGEELLAPVRNFGQPLCDLSGTLPWTVFQSLFDQFLPHTRYQYYWKSHFLETCSDEAIDEMVQIAASAPSDKTQMILSPLGGAMAEVGAEDTAFGRRDMPYMLSIDAVWDDPAEADANVEWARRSWNEMKKYSTGGLYLNFAGLAEEEEDLVQSSLGDSNYSRLVGLKDKYDPENLFRTRLTVQPSAG